MNNVGLKGWVRLLPLMPFVISQGLGVRVVFKGRDADQLIPECVVYDLSQDY